MNAEVIAPMIVGVIFILTVGATVILRGPLGKALADRLAGRPAVSPEDSGAVHDLRQDVDDLRVALGEVQERLDFAERLLVQGRDPELPGPAHEGERPRGRAAPGAT